MNPRNSRRWSAVRARAAHEGHPRRRGRAIVIALCSLMVAGVPAAAFQAGTPVAGSDAPAAVECTVAPRAEDELRALFREVAATPLPSSLDASPQPAVAPAGVPADAQTVAAIEATWQQYLACLGAGDQARMFALLSEDMVRRQFVVDLAFGVTEDALFAYLAATPVPPLPDQAIPFVPFADVRVLDDGRVAVVGPGETPPSGGGELGGEPGRGDVRIFIKQGDRWLLDDWFDLS